METSFSPCVTHIDLECIRRNLHRVPAPAHELMPVVKSDAYGHGLEPVARVLAAEGVRHFAVGTVSEGASLRQWGFDQTVVPLLGAPTPEQMQQAAVQGVTPLVYSGAHLRCAVAQSSPERPLSVANKCETGMGRLGFTPEDVPAFVETLRTAPWVRPYLALSHLSCADMPEQDAYTRQQAKVFFDMCDTLREAFPALQRSLCNSAASLVYLEFKGELLRPGEILYGGNPLCGTAWEARAAGFESAMSVSTPVLHQYTLDAGQSVSYGRTFTAPHPMRVAVLGIGYADGYSRRLSNKASVCIAGRRAPLCGRVCMGMAMADVTHIPQADVEADPVAWVMGGGGQEAVTLQELADVWGTIPYEVQCLLGRNTRRYSPDAVGDTQTVGAAGTYA